jgi:ribosomal protein S11
MASKQRKGVQKKARRKVQRGVVHILATFNNTLVTISDRSGMVIAASSRAVSVALVKEHPLQLKQPRKTQPVNLLITV